MTFFEQILLALALCIDSLVVSTAAALRSRLKLTRGLLLAFTFAVFQGLFPLLGALIGEAFKSFAESVDHWIAFALLSALGVKMIIDAVKSGDENHKNLDVSHFGVICLLAIATSIDAFVVGIPLGIQCSTAQIFCTAGLISAATFVVSLLGVYLGSRQISVPEKVSGIIAGAVLILLGVEILVEHLCL